MDAALPPDRSVHASGEAAQSQAAYDNANRRLRILSFNVNGLRAVLKRRYGPTATVSRLLNDEALQADIVCIQETKLRRAELSTAQELAVAEGWDSFFSSSDSNRGYSGVATFCRSATCLPFDASIGFSGLASNSCVLSSNPGNAIMAQISQQPQVHPIFLTDDMFSPEELSVLDSEGRVVVTDHGAFVLFNVYGPAITSEDPDQAKARMAFKMRFYSALEKRWAHLVHAGKAVIVVGDLNIAPSQIDYPDHDPDFYRLSRPDRRWIRSLLAKITTTPAFTDDEHRPGNLVTFTDCFRAFHSDRRSAFTVWSTATGARANNYGSRIDLTLSAGLPVKDPDGHAVWISGADIKPEVQGSDHCPVWVEISHRGPFPCAPTAPHCAMRYGFVGKQSKLHAWLVQTKARSDNGDGDFDSVVDASSSDVAGNGALPKNLPSRRDAPPVTAASNVPKQASLVSFFHAKKTARTSTIEGVLTAEALTMERTVCEPILEKPNNKTVLSARTESLYKAELRAAELRKEEQLKNAKAAWQGIHARMQVPNCLHGEPAALKRVNKSGSNHGRYFYMCARAEGKGAHAQCSFFKWVEKRKGDASRTVTLPGGTPSGKRLKL